MTDKEIPTVTITYKGNTRTFNAEPKFFKKSGRDGFFGQINMTIDGEKFGGQIMIWGAKREEEPQ